MKRFVALFAVVGMALMICLIGYNQQRIVEDLAANQEYTSEVADLTCQIAVEERVIELPEDGSEYYTTVFVHADWRKRADERQMVAWFQSQPELASLKAQTRFNVVEEGDPQYEWHIKVLGGLPAVMIQTDKGRVIYKTSGKDMPGASNVMAADLVELFNKRPWLRIRPWKRPRPCPQPCPQPGPEPDPTPKPSPDIDVDVKIPDLRPPQPRMVKTGGDFWVILGIVVVLAAGLTIVWEWKSRVGF